MMNKRYCLLLLILLCILISGCASNRPIDLSGKAMPDSDFLKRKVAIEYPKLQKVTQCPLDEFLKAMKPGKWMKMSEAQWLYNMKNEKFDIYVLFTKHPLHQDVVLFQKVIINGRDVSEDGLVTLFRFTLSELGLDVLKSNDVSSEGVLTLLNADSSENTKASSAKTSDLMETVDGSADASTETLKSRKEETASAQASGREKPEAKQAAVAIMDAETKPALKTASDVERRKNERMMTENAMSALPVEEKHLTAPDEKQSKASKTTTGSSFPAVSKTPQIQKEPETAKDNPKKTSTEKVRVVGNRDSKLYHLPGMKYYYAVKAYHRVIFGSEADAIRAGYSKAPR